MTDTDLRRSVGASAANDEVEHREGPAHQGRRVFQVLAGAAGAALFVVGLVALFRVDDRAGFSSTSGAVLGFGFSPAAAIAAVVFALSLVPWWAGWRRSAIVG